MNIRCRFSLHKWRVIREINENIREVECIKCGKKLAVNDVVKDVFELTEEIRAMHNHILKMRGAEC